MYNNVDVYPLDKLAMDNEGYHDPVDREYYLSPSGEDIPEKLKQESSFSKSQEDLKKGQNGTAGFRPKNSRFDSGKFSGSQIYNFVSFHLLIHLFVIVAIDHASLP